MTIVGFLPGDLSHSGKPLWWKLIFYYLSHTYYFDLTRGYTSFNQGEYIPHTLLKPRLWSKPDGELHLVHENQVITFASGTLSSATSIPFEAISCDKALDRSVVEVVFHDERIVFADAILRRKRRIENYWSVFMPRGNYSAPAFVVLVVHGNEYAEWFNVEVYLRVETVEKRREITKRTEGFFKITSTRHWVVDRHHPWGFCLGFLGLCLLEKDILWGRNPWVLWNLI